MAYKYSYYIGAGEKRDKSPAEGLEPISVFVRITIYTTRCGLRLLSPPPTRAAVASLAFPSLVDVPFLPRRRHQPAPLIGGHLLLPACVLIAQNPAMADKSRATEPLCPLTRSSPLYRTPVGFFSRMPPSYICICMHAHIYIEAK